MKSVRWLVSYILVASLGLWLAFAVSMKFMTPARSQEAPANGDLPADFMKEVEQTQVPPANPQPSAKPGAPAQPAANQPPAAAQPPAAPAQQKPAQPQQPAVPPPPANATGDMPVGDGMTAPPPPQQEIIPRDGYIYDPTGKRNPFKAFRTVRPTQQEALRPNETLEPLQRWELERLQVVGILWDVRTPRAMIRDPDGAVFTVTKNSKIGRNEGFVAAIREGEVVVVETKYEDGKSAKETRVMELKK